MRADIELTAPSYEDNSQAVPLPHRCLSGDGVSTLQSRRNHAAIEDVKKGGCESAGNRRTPLFCVCLA